MSKVYEPTIEDHLSSLGFQEGWILSLAMMISQFTGFDSAISTARAVDMVSHPRFGKAVAYFTKGFLVMSQELDNGLELSPCQRETMKKLVDGIVHETECLAQNT